MTALREVIGRTLTRARNAPMPPGSTTLSRIESNTTDLFERVVRHQREHHAAGETGRLTAEAMREDRARLLEELQQDAAGLIQDTRERIDAYRERLEAAMKPAFEPTEERLGNARSDARMVLDGATRETMARELADLAEDGDNAVCYLMLMTPWVTYYLRGRGLKTLVGMWNHAKVRFMAEVLTADGMRAFQSLDTAADLAEITLRQRNIIDWYVKDVPSGAPVVS